MSVLFLARFVAGLGAIGVLVGLAVPMLPLQEPVLLSSLIFALFASIAALAVWFAVGGGLKRHRHALLWSAISAVGLAAVGFTVLYVAAPSIWPDTPFAIPLLSLAAGSTGFIVGVFVGPAKLWLLSR